MAVTSTNNLRQGSKGSDVSELQKRLNSTGNYNLDVDGSFGPKTLAAVKDYQSKNGLAVDGIVGTKTWGALTSGATKNTTGSNAGKADKPATAGGATPTTSPGGVTYGDYQNDPYDPNKNSLYTDAVDASTQHSANQPGQYQNSEYFDIANDYLNKLMNRDPFSYDFNSDALYQQYRDNYILQGQMAMMDTMGQAAAMTGGYGNSYAQSVGQQTYNQHLNQLNDIIPELYGMAYDRYRQEGQDMKDMYNLYMGLEEQSYNRWNDSVDRWYQEDTRLTNNVNNLWNQGFDLWSVDNTQKWNEYVLGREEKATEEERLWQEDQTKKQWEREDQQNKWNLLQSKISAGYKYTEKDLADAGMSKEDADFFTTAYENSKTSKGGNGGTTPIDYSDLDFDTQGKWGKEAGKATSWSGLTSVWNRMKIAEHDPLKSAGFIMEKATEMGITPTAADLDSFQTKLEKEGLDADEVAQFLGEWATVFGIVDSKRHQPPENGIHVTGGSGGGGGRYLAMPY